METDVLEKNSQMKVLEEWLLTQVPELQRVDPDTDLFAEHILDSISVMEFLLKIEELSGAELTVTFSTFKQVRTLRLACANFLQQSQ